MPFLEPVNSVAAGGLRDQELGRIEKAAVIDAEFAADRRFEPKAEADRVRPDGTLVLATRCCSAGTGWTVKNVARHAENIAAIIERHEP